jgi:phosphohistidine phosphatase
MRAQDIDTSMDLILWRHAEAEDGIPDAKRALTVRGLKQAAKMATWLNERLPEKMEILVSPALRTQQTAQALGRPFTTCKAIDVGEPPTHLLAAAGWPEGANRCVLIVGHQPTLGQVAALLLGGSEGEWSVKKGAVWWLSSRVRAGETRVVLRTSISPDMLDTALRSA